MGIAGVLRPVSPLIGLKAFAWFYSKVGLGALYELSVEYVKAYTR
jgi:hypothetical protein